MKHMFDYDMMVSDKKCFIKKADIWLISAVLVIALLILLVFRLNRTQGSYAKVSGDSMVIMQIPLVQSEAKYYLMTESIQHEPLYSIEELSAEEWLNIQRPSEYYNVILCQDGEVRMIESNCPDQICVHHSAVSATGENIICLPHKIVIEIISDEEHELDGVAY